MKYFYVSYLNTALSKSALNFVRKGAVFSLMLCSQFNGALIFIKLGNLQEMYYRKSSMKRNSMNEPLDPSFHIMQPLALYYLSSLPSKCPHLSNSTPVCKIYSKNGNLQAQAKHRRHQKKQYSATSKSTLKCKIGMFSFINFIALKNLMFLFLVFQMGQCHGGGYCFIAPTQLNEQALLSVTATIPLRRTTQLPAASELTPSVRICQVWPVVEYQVRTESSDESQTCLPPDGRELKVERV